MSENQNTYLDMYSTNGVLQSTHLTKNFVLEISIRKETNMKRIRVDDNTSEG